MVRAMALSDHCRSRLHPEVSARLLEGDLDTPALHEPPHDLRGLVQQVSADMPVRTDGERLVAARVRLLAAA